MAMVVWLFVALILIQSYSASLTSILTVGQLRPSVVDVNSLLKAKAKVGCDKNSFMSEYLGNVVGFGAGCVVTHNSDEYAQALSTGAIKAAFLEIPSSQLFLDKNPNGFTVTGRTYEIGGFAFHAGRTDGRSGFYTDITVCPTGLCVVVIRSLWLVL